MAVSFFLWLNNTYGHNIFYSFILSYYDYYGNDLHMEVQISPLSFDFISFWYTQ